MPIPIQNIYFLLSYAWNILEEQEQQSVTIIEAEGPLDLLVHLLQQQAEKLIQKGLTKHYIRQTQTLRGIKGKLNLTDTVRQDLLRLGQAVCTFETLSADILPNQIIKSVLHQLLKTAELRQTQKDKIKIIYRAFKEVTLIEITPAHFNAIPLNTINKYYSAVFTICTFIWQQLLPEPGGEQIRFIDFREDEKQMARLFETFVRNFYSREQRKFTVKSERINWQVTESNPESMPFLPQMITDISLEAQDRKIIIDTKYYKNALVPHYDKQKIISAHLYQLFAYLQNQKTKAEVKTEGILLYPVVNQELDLTYQLPGHQISIKTINLNQTWQNIKADLLQLIA